MSTLKFLADVAASFFISLGLISSPVPATTPNLGATPGQAAALYSGYLASGITATDSSMTLSQGTFRDGANMTGYQCFTVDANTPQTEYICGTASGTAVTALMRGISVSNPNTTSSAAAYQHNRFASVDITDYPDLEIHRRMLMGSDPLGGVLYYASGTTNAAVSASGQNLVNYNVLASTSIAGAVNADATHAGLVQAATNAQIAAGNATGSTGALLFAPNQFHSATSTATTTVVVTRTTGKLDPNFIDASSPYTWNGTSTFVGNVSSTATTTFTGNVQFTGGVTLPGNASGTTANNLVVSSFSSVNTYSTSNTSTLMNVTIPANTLGTSGGVEAKIFFSSVSANGNGSGLRFSATYASTTFATATIPGSSSGNIPCQTGITQKCAGVITLELFGNNSASSEYGSLSSLFSQTQATSTVASSTASYNFSTFSTSSAIAQPLILQSWNFSNDSGTGVIMDGYIVTKFQQ